MDQMNWNFACQGLLWVSIEFCSSQVHATTIKAKPVLASKCYWPLYSKPKLNSNQQKPPACKISSHFVYLGLSNRHPLVQEPRLCSPLLQHIQRKFFQNLQHTQNFFFQIYNTSTQNLKKLSVFQVNLVIFCLYQQQNITKQNIIRLQ